MRAQEFIQIGLEAECVVSWDREALQKLGLSVDELDVVHEAFVMLLQEAVDTIRGFPDDVQPLLSDLYVEKLANLDEVHRLLLAEPDSKKKCELMRRKVSESHIQKLYKAGLKVDQSKEILRSLRGLQDKATSSAVALTLNVPFAKMAREQFIRLRKIHGWTFSASPLPRPLREPPSSGLTPFAVRTAMTLALISAAGLPQEEADWVREHVRFFVGMAAMLQEDLTARLRNLFIGIVLDMLDLDLSEGYLAEGALKSLEDRSKDAYNHAWIKIDRKVLASLDAQELDFLANAYANLGGYFIEQARTFTPLMMRVFARAALNQVDAVDKNAQARN